MLLAELKNEVVLKKMINPITYEDRIVDSFFLIPIDYTLGQTGDTVFQIVFTKKELNPINPASEAIDEQETVVEYPIVMTFQDKLSEEILSQWGTDDTYLLNVFAERYNLDIDSFVLI
jgi:hypothetical protein